MRGGIKLRSKHGRAHQKLILGRAKKHHKLALSAAILAASFSFSHAADQIDPDQGVVPIDSGRFDWSGGYVGLQVGYGHGSYSYEFTGPFFEVGDNEAGGFVGGHIGWNAQNGNTVYGIEAEYNASGINGEASCPNPIFTCSADVFSFGSIRGRLGVASDNWLVYGLAGWATAALNARSDSAGFGSGGEVVHHHGWTAGVGVENAISGTDWTWRTEYAYYDFGAADHDIFAPVLLVSHDLNMHTVRFGVSKKF